MSDEHVLLDINYEQKVATITLNRPPNHNALNESMMLSLQNIFHNLNNDPKVQVAILAANGKSFCAGADLNEMRKLGSSCPENKHEHELDHNFKNAQNLAKLYSTIFTFGRPLIAKVTGNAFGGGVGLLAACDYVIATSNTKFSLPEVKIGLIPAVISPYLFMKCGHGNINGEQASLRYLFLTGETFNAYQAKALGLVQEIAEINSETSAEIGPGENKATAEIDTIVEERVQAFLKAKPKAQALAKEWLNRWSLASLISTNINMDFNLQDSLRPIQEFTARQLALIRQGEEAQSGITKILEKTKMKKI